MKLHHVFAAAVVVALSVALVAAEDKVDPPGYGDPVRPDGGLGGVVFLGS